MTENETKTYNSLKLLGFNELKEINERELKQAYLKAAKLYHPDTCQNEVYKDGKMFNSVKEAYDYLAKDMLCTNETIRNIMNPESKTYNYQTNDSYSYSNNSGYNGYSNFNTEFRRPADRPSLFNLLLFFIMPYMGFFMALMTRRFMPKSSKWYILTSIISVAITIGINFIN